MRKPHRLALALVMIALLAPIFALRVTAQDGAVAAPANPTDLIDHMMSMIGQGRIDDGVTMMDGLNTHPDLKEDVRGQLIHVRDEQGQYHGYEIAAIQKFTGQFQRIDVIANYDQQPVLMRFSFYRPQGNDGKWTVLYFHVHTNILEILDLLKDAPVDYFAGRGARR